MRKRFLFSAFATAMMVASQAQARITIEPYVGYNLLGSVSGDPEPADNSVNGLGFGARALYGYKRIFGGVDFRMNMLKNTDEATDAESDFDNTQLGVVIGGEFNMLRVWGGLNFINQFTAENDSYSKGMGFKFGLGYKVHDYVSVNAEYMLNPISETCTASDVCTDLPEGQSTNINTIFLSVSAPFSI